MLQFITHLFKYYNFHTLFMSEKEIAYDLRLEDEFEEVKLRIWVNEELQIQPNRFHYIIKKNFIKKF